jgi:hypothetical protein
MVVFSFGSNMDLDRLRRRCPSARVVGSGYLREHQLSFRKHGVDGTGKADIVPSAEALVWGVLHEIPAAEKPLLDSAEGLGHSYGQKDVVIQTDEGPVRATTYFAIDVANPALAPADWYLDHVLRGARREGLPATYAESIALYRGKGAEPSFRSNQVVDD